MRAPALRSIGKRGLSSVVGALALASLTSCTIADPASEQASSSTERPSCREDLPASWTDALRTGLVDIGGVSARPLAAGPAGEVVAVRDNGRTRDVVLIAADGDAKTLHVVPNPDQDDVALAVVDHRWVVIGVGHAPRGANGIIPAVERIDVIDRRDGQLRTIAQTTEEDRRSGSLTIDSVALYQGTVYWITHDTFASTSGVLRSFDLADGSGAEVATGSMARVRATAAGLTWDVGWGPEGTTSEVKFAAALPAEVAAAVGAGPSRLTLATDGEVYAWRDGATGLSWWSPKTGLVRITGDVGGRAARLPDIWVAGPFVVVGAGDAATVVDVRSGTVVDLPVPVVDVDGGTMAMASPWPPGGGKLEPTMPTVIRTVALPPLGC
ncbi:hypothetical protein [Mycolicibacterium frederiksbergense]|uniref:hypothetical protein n=1 Tax=Mycolicibacterium frederiksbergense TaxID=117567 RepID=UPI00399BDFA8